MARHDKIVSMSKFHGLGVPIVNVLCVATAALQAIGRGNPGTLRPRAAGDVTAPALERGRYAYVDPFETMWGEQPFVSRDIAGRWWSTREAPP
jgi:predicted amidohydrolase